MQCYLCNWGGKSTVDDCYSLQFPARLRDPCHKIVQPCCLIPHWLQNVAVGEAGESGYIVIGICKAFSPTYLSCSKCTWGAGRFHAMSRTFNNLCMVSWLDGCNTASSHIIIVFMTWLTMVVCLIVIQLDKILPSNLEQVIKQIKRPFFSKSRKGSCITLNLLYFLSVQL